MATVIITLKDCSDGALNLKLESEPGLPGPAAKDQSLTVAQSWALRFLELMRNEARSAEEIDPSEEPW